MSNNFFAIDVQTLCSKKPASKRSKSTTLWTRKCW